MQNIAILAAAALAGGCSSASPSKTAVVPAPEAGVSPEHMAAAGNETQPVGLAGAAPEAVRPPDATSWAGLKRVAVLDSSMAYRERGVGKPVVFLHGNPLSSYVWRGVLPALEGEGQLLAPDLIGMGMSGKPESAYRLRDHVRYLDAWFDALALTDVVLVGHDWGGVLALDWARRHPGRVRGVAVFETLLEERRWSAYPPRGAELFRALRTPGKGEELVLENNGFLPQSLGNGVKTGLSEVDRAAYYAPFPDAASRRPMLQWTRELPIEGEPADVIAIIDQNAAWIESSPQTPKLLLTFAGAPLSDTPRIQAWSARPPRQLRVQALGPAGHHAPEDAPREIASALEAWLPR